MDIKSINFMGVNRHPLRIDFTDFDQCCEALLDMIQQGGAIHLFLGEVTLVIAKDGNLEIALLGNHGSLTSGFWFGIDKGKLVVYSAGKADLGDLPAKIISEYGKLMIESIKWAAYLASLSEEDLREYIAKEQFMELH